MVGDVLFGFMLFMLFIFVAALYFWGHRANKVSKLILELSLQEDVNTLGKLPSYNRMVYSFKPIKVSSWVNE